MLLCKFSGAPTLGLCWQTIQLVVLPMSQLCQLVGNVTLPSMSALQDQPKRYWRHIEKVVGLRFFEVVPVCVYMAVFSEDIVKIVLGESWFEAGWIFRI
jgi:O-antigen/teichoic acid export membrane protein